MSLNKTLIEWVKNPDGSQGYTWNPITGCLNHTPEGLCLGGMFPCYAYRLANGRLRSRYLANENTIMRFSDGYAPMKLKVTDPFYPRFWPERMDELAKRNNLINYKKGYAVKPIGIFPCDMSDLFGIGIPDKWTYDVLELIRDNNYDRFYLLTKQPQNLVNFQFPNNCWVGVTLTNIEQHLALFYSGFKNIKASIKYVSLEPLLENLYFHPEDIKTLGINWVIIGAQTKPYKPPKIEWVEEIVRACDKVGIPVFLKDNLAHKLQYADNLKLFHTPDQHGVLVVRQEMPG